MMIENEQLKAMVEIMKAEMEGVLKQVAQNKVPLGQQLDQDSEPQANVLLQREIIAKERRIYDLERKLQQNMLEVGRLKEERDRIIQISSDLRAELNKAKGMISDYKAQLVGRQPIEENGVIHEDPRENQSDSNPSALGRDSHTQQSVLNLSKSESRLNVQEVQGDQQKQLTNLRNVVAELAGQMGDWVKQST